MNRGSQGVIHSNQKGLACFNEAPIHESGKYYQLPLDRGPLCGFNEAPIHESGK